MSKIWRSGRPKSLRNQFLPQKTKQGNSWTLSLYEQWHYLVASMHMIIVKLLNGLRIGDVMFWG